MKALLLGALLGAVVVFDPVATTYLLRDFSWLRDVPYLLSITTALIVGIAFAVRRFVPQLATAVIHDYWRYFPLLFLVAYQFTGMTIGPLDATEVLIGVFMLLFLGALFIRPEERFVSTPFNVLHAALVIALALSLVSQLKVFAFWKAFKPLVVFFLLVNFLPREGVLQSFLRWLVILAMLSSVFGLVQELAWGAFRVRLSFLPEKALKDMFEMHFGVPVFRPPALMTGYRSLALYLATALLLVLSSLLAPRDTPPLLPRRWLYVAVVLIGSTLGLTLAKDIYIGVSAGIVLLLLVYRPSRIVPLSVAGLAGALAVVTVIAIVPGNVDTALDLSRTVPRTEQERIRLDRDSIEAFLHGPYLWTGRGVGSGARYTAHTRSWPAHNAFILAAAELGIVGLTIYVLIYGLVIARAIALNITVTSGPYLIFVRSLLPILVVVLAGAQFEANYLDEFVWTIFATIEATWIVVCRQARAGTEPLADTGTG